ncbi:MAG: lysoplasmalogenase [Clostridiales bacterium]|nr:lysoplasmalogenase [Clostridiales bacterium]
MIFSLALSTVTIILAFGCVYFRRKGMSFEGMLFKFMSSISFISVAFSGYYFNPVNPAYFVLVSFGLIFGLMGDVLLGIKEIAPTFRSKLIIFGTSSFLVGHIFYLVSFVSIGGFGLIPVVVGVLGSVLGIAIIKTTHARVDKKMAAVLAFYYGILFIKLAVTVMNYIKMRDFSSVFTVAGCLLFIISDTCLSFVYFTPVKKKNTFVTAELATYYVAQIAISLSVAFMR